VIWLRDWSDVFSARALVALAMSSLAVGVHARQLVNKPPAWLTTESALFLLVLPLSGLPVAIQPALHHGLLGVMVLTMVISMVRHLREMISQYPEIGFPLIWLPSTHRPVLQHVSNKLAA
jgi:ethanolaminephosphotransferase